MENNIELTSLEAYKVLAGEVEKELKNPPFRLDPTQLCIIVDPSSPDPIRYRIRHDAHANPIRNSILGLVEEHERSEEERGPPPSAPERDRLVQDTNRKLFALALEGFDYEREASDPRVGPVMLNQIALELYPFLVDLGGATGYRYSQTLRSLELLNRYNSSRNSKESSGSSTGTSAGSGTS